MTKREIVTALTEQAAYMIAQSRRLSNLACDVQSGKIDNVRTIGDRMRLRSGPVCRKGERDYGEVRSRVYNAKSIR